MYDRYIYIYIYIYIHTYIYIYIYQEAKGRRNLEERSESLEQELLSVQIALEDTQKTLRKTTIQSSEKETEVRDKQREITGLQVEINAKQEEIERMRRDDSSLGGSLEAERRGRQRQLAELQGKDRELMLLKSELEAQQASHSKLQDQMSSVKERLNETVVELEEKEEQLRVTKAHNLRLNVTLEQLERGSEADNKDRQVLENRVGVAEGLNTTISKLKAQLSEAESSERFSKEQMKLLSDSKIELEARYAQTLRDNESSRKVYVYIYTYNLIFLYVCIYLCLCVYVYIYVYIYIYKHVYIYRSSTRQRLDAVKNSRKGLCWWLREWSSSRPFINLGRELRLSMLYDCK
jgi:chromosome segregation ATPase